MATTNFIQSFFSVATCLCVAACGGGSNVSNASPRITEVPQQATLGGSTFSIDLADYVTDREGASLTYSVQSGGGSFAGSTYSNTFDTIGTWTVAFQVTDGQKTESGSFVVEVTSANLVVVDEDGSDLLLLDTCTGSFRRIASAMPQPAFVTSFGTRYLIYRRGVLDDIYVVDTFSGENELIASAVEGPATYRSVTASGLVIYSTGTAPDQKLWSYDPVTGLARDFAEGGLSTLTVAVSSADLVFYEAATSGQADVYYYDPSADESVVVGDDAADEQIQTVLPNGGVVFTRIGSGGETDLYYYKVGTGLLEIGSDNTALASREKAFATSDSNSKVVFTAVNGSNAELFVWNPSNSQTTAIATGIDTQVAAIGAGNELVYYDKQSSTEWDAYFYDLDDGTSATVRDDSDKSLVGEVSGDGSTNWAFVHPTGSSSKRHAVSLVASPTTKTWNSSTSNVLGGVLDNGDYVAQRNNGTAISVFDVSAGSWGSEITGTGLAFGGDGLAAGDFVYQLEVSGQQDLKMWDASAASSVVVSDTTGDDSYELLTLDDTILFTRKVGGNTTADLFSWDGTSTTQLTAADSEGVFHDYSTAGAAFAVRKQ